MEHPSKGHVGDNTNSCVLSIVERLSSSWKFKTKNYRESKYSGPQAVSLSIIQCPYLGGSTTRGSTEDYCHRCVAGVQNS